MQQRKNTIRKTNPDRLVKIVIVFLSALGALDALYLLILKLTQEEAMCIGNHGCITVNNSIYSMFYNIPVSLVGLVAYLLIGTLILFEDRLGFLKSNAPLAVFGLSLTGFLFSLYLTYVEFFIIYAVCPFCIGSAIIITAILVLAIIRLKNQSNP